MLGYGKTPGILADWMSLSRDFLLKGGYSSEKDIFYFGVFYISEISGMPRGFKL